MRPYVECLTFVRPSSARLLMENVTYGSGVPPPILAALRPRALKQVTESTPIAVSARTGQASPDPTRLKITHRLERQRASPPNLIEVMSWC